MMVSELLWVGQEPKTSIGTQGIRHCATGKQAAEAIRANYIAVVPTTDVAKDAVLAMGYGSLYAAHAVSTQQFDPNDPSIYLY